MHEGYWKIWNIEEEPEVFYRGGLYHATAKRHALFRSGSGVQNAIFRSSV